MADSKENTEFKVDSKVTITMKIDSPPDSAVNSSNEDNDKVQNEKDSEDSSKSSTSSEESNGKNCDLKKESNVSDIPDFKICKPDRKEENTNSTFKLKPSFLRPSQLSSVTNFGSTSILQPVKFQNPFNKASDPVSEENDNDNHKKSATDDVIKEPTITKKEEIKSEDSKPKFLKLGLGSNENENNVHNTLTASTSTPSFVFGQNLKQRVAVTYDTESSDSSGKEDIKEETTTNENGSSELLFSNAAAVCKSTTKPSLSLSEAAQELEEASRANKRKYNEVTLLTGEEEETNVLQINCKLFAFDKVSGSWQERGRGSLRLNDKDEESRLVARTAGTQRLILNTKIWSGMTCEIAGPKSLRITAMDVQGDIRIFIIQAAPKEVDQLHSLIIQRLKRAQERQPKKLLTEH